MVLSSIFQKKKSNALIKFIKNLYTWCDCHIFLDIKQNIIDINIVVTPMSPITTILCFPIETSSRNRNSYH